MKLFETLTNLFKRHKDKLPDNLDSVDEVKAKAKQMMDQHSDKLDKVTDKIPGETDDKLVDKARDALR